MRPADRYVVDRHVHSRLHVLAVGDLEQSVPVRSRLGGHAKAEERTVHNVAPVAALKHLSRHGSDKDQMALCLLTAYCAGARSAVRQWRCLLAHLAAPLRAVFVPISHLAQKERSTLHAH